MEIKQTIINGINKSSKLILTIVIAIVVMIFSIGFLLGAIIF